MKMSNKAVVSVLAVIMCMSVLTPDSLRSQEVLIRRGDRLELIVPSRPELNRQMIVNENGNVTVPVIGTIDAEGLNTEEARISILSELRDVFPSVDNIELNLLSKESRLLIYVHGQVLNPGKYEFRSPPNVWEAVREAGGATAEASLQSVLLIRSESDGEKTSFVNLQEAIDSGNFSGLPILKPGDTVIIPEATAQFQGSGAVKVMGAVVTPGSYSISGENKNLADALLAAGGPLENASLGEIKIIRSLPAGGTKTIQVNFNNFLDRGDMNHNPPIRRGDTVNVPRQRNYLHVILTDPRFLVSVITAVGTLSAVLLR